MTNDEIVRRLKILYSGAAEMSQDTADVTKEFHGSNEILWTSAQAVADIWESLLRDINDPDKWLSDEMMGLHEVNLGHFRKMKNEHILR